MPAREPARFGTRVLAFCAGAVWLGASGCKVELAGTGRDQADMNPIVAGDPPDDAIPAFDGGPVANPPTSTPPPRVDAAAEDAGLDAATTAEDGGVPDTGIAGDHDARDHDADDPTDADAACTLDGRYALRVQFDVNWVGTRFASFVPIISPGSGELSFTLIGDIATAPAGDSAVFRACQASVPDFVSTLPDEHYAVRFATAVWDSPGMPSFGTNIAGCHEVGCTMTTPTIHALIGSALPDPSGRWPEAVADATWPDHDGDGNPGIAADMLGPRTGTDYAYPPVDLVAARRVNALRLGLRVSLALDAERTSCDQLRGAVREGAVDTRAVDCVATSNPKKCSANELGFLNDNLPVWTVAAGSFEGVRISPTASCVDARIALGSSQH